MPIGGHQTHQTEFPNAVTGDLLHDAWTSQPDPGCKCRSECREARTCEGVSCPIAALVPGLGPVTKEGLPGAPCVLCGKELTAWACPARRVSVKARTHTQHCFVSGSLGRTWKTKPGMPGPQILKKQPVTGPASGGTYADDRTWHADRVLILRGSGSSDWGSDTSFLLKLVPRFLLNREGEWPRTLAGVLPEGPLCHLF